MQNEAIAHDLETLAFLLELQGENPFKIRAFQKVAGIVAELSDPVETLVANGTLESIEGIGKGSRALIEERIQTGKMAELETARAAFPPGIVELREVRGLGVKKIKTLFEQLQISSLAELEYSCHENRLVDLKGFGGKTQENILKSIHHLKSVRGRALLPQALHDAESLLVNMPGAVIVGELARYRETVDRIELLAPKPLKAPARSEGGLPVVVHTPEAGESFAAAKFRLESAPDWLQELGSQDWRQASTEEDIFRAIRCAPVPPEVREGSTRAVASPLLEETHIRGVFHLHTTASDGKNSLEEMVAACVEQGWEYVGVSDHSQSAFYAGGLKVPDVKRQRAAIDELREKFPGITIFHGIESDILADGSLDYPENILSEFDFVVASVHGQMKMNRAAMTDRICRALENPHTTWLGHMTGRLLLGRPGYEVDFEQILRTAEKTGAGLELNSNPYRLDVDWRLLPEVRRRRIPVGVFPDAHSVAGLHDVKWGVMMARKAGLGPADVSNTKTAREMKAWLESRK